MQSLKILVEGPTASSSPTTTTLSAASSASSSAPVVVTDEQIAIARAATDETTFSLMLLLAAIGLLSWGCLCLCCCAGYFVWRVRGSSSQGGYSRVGGGSGAEVKPLQHEVEVSDNE